MTKEKRRAVLSATADDTSSTGEWKKETGFKYTVSDRKLTPEDLLEIAGATRSNFLLSHLTEAQSTEVFSSMEECICNASDTVIQAGQPGEWFYVVHSGTYDGNSSEIHNSHLGLLAEKSASLSPCATAYIDGQLIHTYRLDEAAERDTIQGGVSDEVSTAAAAPANEPGDARKPGIAKHGVSFGELALLYLNQARYAAWRLPAPACILCLLAVLKRQRSRPHVAQRGVHPLRRGG